jgi:hypothetical protein
MSTLAVLVESSEGDQIKSFSTRKTLAEAYFCMLFRVVTLAGVLFTITFTLLPIV